MRAIHLFLSKTEIVIKALGLKKEEWQHSQVLKQRENHAKVLQHVWMHKLSPSQSTVGKSGGTGRHSLCAGSTRCEGNYWAQRETRQELFFCPWFQIDAFGNVFFGSLFFLVCLVQHYFFMGWGWSGSPLRQSVILFQGGSAFHQEYKVPEFHTILMEHLKNKCKYHQKNQNPNHHYMYHMSVL